MNCRPGDLAYITNAYLPENIGRVVEVIKLAGPNPDGHGPEWEVKISTRIRTVVLASRMIASPTNTVHVHPDAWLRPINGAPKEQGERTATPLSAEEMASSGSIALIGGLIALSLGVTALLCSCGVLA